MVTTENDHIQKIFIKFPFCIDVCACVGNEFLSYIDQDVVYLFQISKYI